MALYRHRPPVQLAAAALWDYLWLFPMPVLCLRPRGGFRGAMLLLSLLDVNSDEGNSGVAEKVGFGQFVASDQPLGSGPGLFPAWEEALVATPTLASSLEHVSS